MSTEGRGLVDSGRSSENSANDNYPGLESVGKRPIYAKTVQTGRLADPAMSALGRGCVKTVLRVI